MSKSKNPDHPIFETYVLLDPRKSGNYIYRRGIDEIYNFNYEPIYIGKTNDPIRMYRHAKIASKNDINRLIYNVIRKIKRETGQDPITFKILQNVTEDEAFAEEIKLIAMIGRRDLRRGSLCNETDGGDGAVGGIKPKGFAKGKNNHSYGKKGELCPNFGKKAYNNGNREIRCFPNEQPEGWEEGSLQDHAGTKNPMYGKTDEDHPNFGKTIYNDGTNYGRFFEGEEPEDWIHGLLESTKKKLQGKTGEKSHLYGKTGSSHPCYGLRWYTDGVSEIKCLPNTQHSGWILGRSKKWYTDGTNNQRCLVGNQPEGWVRGRFIKKRR